MKRLAAVRTDAALDKHILFRALILFLTPVLFQFRALFVCETIWCGEHVAASRAVYDSSIRAVFYRAE